jgi:cyanophycin synthetase
MGRLCGSYFDNIVIRRGHYLRGRDEQNMYQILQKGIKEGGKTESVTIIPESDEAIRHAVKQAIKNELVVVLGDGVPNDISIVNQIRDEANAIGSPV